MADPVEIDPTSVRLLTGIALDADTAARATAIAGASVEQLIGAASAHLAEAADMPNFSQSLTHRTAADALLRLAALRNES